MQQVLVGPDEVGEGFGEVCVMSEEVPGKIEDLQTAVGFFHPGENLASTGTFDLVPSDVQLSEPRVKLDHPPNFFGSGVGDQIVRKIQFFDRFVVFHGLEERVQPIVCELVIFEVELNQPGIYTKGKFFTCRGWS